MLQAKPASDKLASCLYVKDTLSFFLFFLSILDTHTHTPNYLWVHNVRNQSVYQRLQLTFSRTNVIWKCNIEHGVKSSPSFFIITFWLPLLWRLWTSWLNKQNGRVCIIPFMVIWWHHHSFPPHQKTPSPQGNQIFSIIYSWNKHFLTCMATGF